MHQQCNDRLLTKVYKFLNGYSPDIMNDVFHLRQNTYNLQNFHAFATDVPRNNCMLNSVVYRADQLWETLPFDLKNSPELFKKGLKNWRCIGCPCQISSRFIAAVNSSHQYSFLSNFISILFITSLLYIFDIR